MFSRRVIRLVAALMLLATPFTGGLDAAGPDGAAAGQLDYNPTDLSIEGTTRESEANAINDAGHIVGTAVYGNGVVYPVIWRSGQIEKLEGGDHAVPNDINSSGQIAGTTPRFGYDEESGVLWNNGVVTKLPPLPGHIRSRAIAINDAGVIVGESDKELGSWPKAVRWDNGVVTELPAYPEAFTSSPKGINDSGQIVGGAHVTGEAYWRPVIWDGVTVTSLSGLVESGEGVATAINNSGQIVGWAESSTERQEDLRHAVMWKDGQITDLGTLAGDDQSHAFDINDAGQIVGVSGVHDGPWHAVLWENGEIVLLGTLPGGQSSDPRSINESGQITGMIEVKNTWGTRDHAVRWDAVPVGSVATEVAGENTSAALQVTSLGLSSANAISESGTVVGSHEPSDEPPIPAQWIDGNVTDLRLPEGDQTGMAYAVNEFGQKVGCSVGPSGVSRPVLWSDASARSFGGAVQVLESAPAGSGGAAFDVNESAVVAGVIAADDGVLVPAFWVVPGVAKELPLLPGDTSGQASAISDGDVIVGSSISAAGVPHAVRWEDGNITALPPLVPDEASEARDLNEMGQIVEWAASEDGSDHAVLWENWQIRDLGYPDGGGGSVANAINDSGQIVGYAWEARLIALESRDELASVAVRGFSGALHVISDGRLCAADRPSGEAMFWDGGQIIDLGDFPYDRHSLANDVNNTGQIVGDVITDNGSVLWEPATAGGGQTRMLETTPVWCNSAGEDSLQGLSIFLAGIFQPRSLLITTEHLVVPSQQKPTALISVDPATGNEQWLLPVTGAGSGLLVATAPVGGLVIATGADSETSSRVFAVDLATGIERWSIELQAGMQYPPIVSDGIAYVPISNGSVAAFEGATGSLLWVAASGPRPGPIVVADATTLVVGLDGGAVAGIDRTSGEELWRRTFVAGADGSYDGWDWAGTAGAGVVVLKALEGDLELTGSTIYLLDPTTGALRGSRSFLNSVATTPLIIGGTIIVGAGSSVVALDSETGADLWTRNLRGEGVSFFDPGYAPDNERLLLMEGIGGSEDDMYGVIYAFDAESGQTIWSIVSREVWLIDTSPWLVADLLFVRGFGADGNAAVCAFDAGALSSPTTTPVAS